MSCDYIWFSLVFEFDIKPFLSLTTTIKPTSAAQHASVASLLKDRYSLYQIQTKTGLGKSSVERIGKELELNKENYSGGHFAKLTPRDKQIII